MTDFVRECGLSEIPGDIGELKHLVRSSALQNEAPLIPQLKIFLGTGNNLTCLPFELFTLSNLTVLSLCENLASSWLKPDREQQTQVNTGRNR